MYDIQTLGCLVTSEDSSCSGMILNEQYILTHSSILRKHLLQHPQQVNGILTAKQIPQIPIRILLQNNGKVCTASFYHIWKAKKFAETYKKLFSKNDVWKFSYENVDGKVTNKNTSSVVKDNQTDESNDELSPEEVAILVDMIPYFVLLKLNTPLDDSYFGPITLQKEIKLGQDVLIVCTPFGSVCPAVFYNTVSSGIVSQCVDNVLLLTDAKCAPTTEGAPVFVRHTDRVCLVGLVVAPLFWKNTEWLGLSVVCAASDIVQCLLESHIQLDYDLFSIDNKQCGLLAEYTHSPVLYTDQTYVSPKLQIHDSAWLDLRSQTECVVLVQGPGCWGTGVVIEPGQGYILTCAHVVRNANKVKVRFYNKRWYNAHIEYSTQSLDENMVYDLALLVVEDWEEDFVIPKVKAVRPVKGMSATVLGHTPFGGEQSLPPMVSRGLVSQVVYRASKPVLLQTSCVVQSGASGGPIFDHRGRLLGIVTSNAKDTVSGGCYPHLNLVIPAVAVWSQIQTYIKTKDTSLLSGLHIKDKVTRNLWMLKSNAVCEENFLLEKSKL